MAAAPARPARAPRPARPVVVASTLVRPYFYQDAAGNRWTINPATGQIVDAAGRIGVEAITVHRAAHLGADVAPQLPIGTERAAAREARDVNLIARPRAPTDVIARDANHKIIYDEVGIDPETGAVQTAQRVVGLQYKVVWNVPIPATTIRGFAHQLIKANALAPPGATLMASTIRMIDPDGHTIFRSISSPAPTPEAVQANRADLIDELTEQIKHHFEAGAFVVSDPVNPGTELDTGYFTTNYRVPARVAGVKAGTRCWRGLSHPHFELTDYAATTKNDNCLFATLRAVASNYGLPPPNARPETIRTMCGIPPGPVAPTSDVLAQLAGIYGLRIRVISGVVAQEDHQRTFSDNQHRAVGRNRCVCPKWFFDIYGEAGPQSAPSADLYIGADVGHIFHINAVKTIHLCQVTGDLLRLDDEGVPIELSSSEQRKRVIEQGRPWYAKTVPQKTKKQLRERVIVFDYETTFNRLNGELEPYALGWLEFDPAHPPKNAAGEIDFTLVRDQVNISVLSDTLSCNSMSDGLIDRIVSAEADARFTLIGYNNSRFDNYLLANALTRAEALNGVFANSGGIRNLNAGPADDRLRHSTLDLAKLLPATSLADACAGFRTLPIKVEGFSHQIPQAAAALGQLPGWIRDNNAELLNYLEGDVLSTACLFSKLQTAFNELCGGSVKLVGRNSITTAGGAAWEHLKAVQLAAGSPLPAAVRDHELDNVIRSAIVGGRTQRYSDGPVVLNEPLAMIDFASLYPTVMSAPARVCSLFSDEIGFGLYPDEAEPEPVTTYQPGVVGVYRVHIKSQPELAIIPHRVAGQPLNWSPKQAFNATITHTDLAMLLQHGGSVDVLDGFVWRHSTRGKFSHFILPLAAEKDRQDKLKKSNSAEYNGPLRELTKLLQNASSGKMCQRNYDELCIYAKTEADRAAALKRFASVPDIEVQLIGDSVLYFGKKPAANIYSPARAKPSIMAVLTYSYARTLLYRVMAGNNPVYGDTDSILLRRSDYDQIRRNFPMLDPENDARPEGRGKQLGDLEEELGEYASCRAFIIQPKEYCVLLYDAAGKRLMKGGKEQSKIRAKGVNPRRDRMFIRGPSYDENVARLATATLADRSDEYERAVGDINAVTLPIADALETYFEQRAAGETVNVLCSQLERLHRNRDHAFTLRQRYLIKQIAGNRHGNEDEAETVDDE